MEVKEFINSFKYLSLAFGKDFNQEQCEVYYDFFSKYSDKCFVSAVKQSVRDFKYMPSIKELIEECEKYNGNQKNEILEYMKSKGYFHSELEYEKALTWLQRGVVPGWFKERMNQYSRAMRGICTEIGTDTLLIESDDRESALAMWESLKG